MATNKKETAAKKVVLPPDVEKHWMLMEDVCKLFGKTRFTISAWCREKILKRTKFGIYTLISRESVDNYMKRYFPQQPQSTTSGKRKVKAAPKKTPKATP